MFGDFEEEIAASSGYILDCGERAALSTAGFLKEIVVQVGRYL